MAGGRTIELDEALAARLDGAAGAAGVSRPDLAAAAIEEWLRMERHPGVCFRNGAAGRRAALHDGPDIWQLMAHLRGASGEDGARIRETADLLGLPERSVRAAMRYYAEHPEEIDGWIRRNDEAADEWQRMTSHEHA